MSSLANPSDMEQLFQQNTLVEAVPLQHEVIIFHPQSNRFCILNHTSAFIWSRLQSPVSLPQIVHELSASFDGVVPTQALADVRQALADFIALDLVVTQTSQPSL